MNQRRHDLKIMVYEEIAKIYNVEITLNKKYKTITMPLGEKFAIAEIDGKTIIKLDRLGIHSIVFLE